MVEGRWRRAGLALLGVATLGLVYWVREPGAPWREELLGGSAVREERERWGEDGWRWPWWGCAVPRLEPMHCSLSGKWKNWSEAELGCKRREELVWLDAEGRTWTKQTNCSYRGVWGGLKPKTGEVESVGPWRSLPVNKSFWVPHQQFEVACRNGSNTVVYRDAFAHVEQPDGLRKFVKSSSDRLSIDMLVLDSVSMNQFQRHMPLSWPQMQELGFLPFYGYNKISDNTLPNIHPILTGQRFRGVAESDPAVKPTPVAFDVEANSDFFWESQMSGCASLYAVDGTGGYDTYYYVCLLILSVEFYLDKLRCYSLNS